MSNTLGQIVKEHHETRGLLPRQVATALEMDTALLSKFGRNEIKPNKDQVLTFAKNYVVKAEAMLIVWLSDKIAAEKKMKPFLKEG